MGNESSSFLSPAPKVCLHFEPNDALYNLKDPQRSGTATELQKVEDKLRAQLQDEKEDREKERGNHEIKLAKMREDYNILLQQFEASKSREELNLIEIKKKDRDVDRLTQQLSKHMHQKLSEDESSFENINTTSRPSKIVEDFSELTTSQWLDAKDALDEAFPESDEECRTHWLCQRLLDAYKLAHDHLNRYRGHFLYTVQQPVESLYSLTKADRPESEQDSDIRADEVGAEDFNESLLGRDLRSSVISFVKTHSDRTNTEKLAEILEQNLEAAHSSNLEVSDELRGYIREACKLMWRMVVQKPPLVLKIPGIGKPPSKWDHEVYFGCPKDSTNVISSYVYPIIYQSGKSLTKGKVFVVPQARFYGQRYNCLLYNCNCQNESESTEQGSERKDANEQYPDKNKMDSKEQSSGSCSNFGRTSNEKVSEAELRSSEDIMPAEQLLVETPPDETVPGDNKRVCEADSSEFADSEEFREKSVNSRATTEELPADKSSPDDMGRNRDLSDRVSDATLCERMSTREDANGEQYQVKNSLDSKEESSGNCSNFGETSNDKCFEPSQQETDVNEGKHLNGDVSSVYLNVYQCTDAPGCSKEQKVDRTDNDASVHDSDEEVNEDEADLKSPEDGRISEADSSEFEDTEEFLEKSAKDGADTVSDTTLCERVATTKDANVN